MRISIRVRLFVLKATQEFLFWLIIRLRQILTRVEYLELKADNRYWDLYQATKK